jgi:hypothetical protein
MRATVSPTPLVDDLKCLASAKAMERRSFASIAKPAVMRLPGFVPWVDSASAL